VCFGLDLARRVQIEGPIGAPRGSACGLRPKIRLRFGKITSTGSSNNSATVGTQECENVPLKQAIVTGRLDH